MKINDKGEVVLSKNEWRIGNFVIKDEENHVKIVTANAPAKLPLWSIRYRKDAAISAFILLCAEHLHNKNYADRLHNWLSVMYNATSIIPDIEENLLVEINTACDKCFAKTKHFYGVQDLTDEEDAKILAEEREKVELKEDIENIGTV